jgi:hypothetical protein
MKHVLSIESVDLKTSKIKKEPDSTAPVKEDSDEVNDDDDSIEEEDNVFSEEKIIVIAKKSVINAICSGILREHASCKAKKSQILNRPTNGGLNNKKSVLDPSKSIMFHKKTTVRPITVVNSSMSAKNSTLSTSAGKIITRMKLRAEVDLSLDRGEYEHLISSCPSVSNVLASVDSSSSAPLDLISMPLTIIEANELFNKAVDIAVATLEDGVKKRARYDYLQTEQQVRGGEENLRLAREKIDRHSLVASSNSNGANHSTMTSATQSFNPSVTASNSVVADELLAMLGESSFSEDSIIIPVRNQVPNVPAIQTINNSNKSNIHSFPSSGHVENIASSTGIRFIL